MNPKQRIDLISDIAKKLQKDHTTSDINVILGGYGLKTEQVTMVDSKKNYVMSLLKEQPDRLILKIATEFQIEIPENLEVPTPLTSDKLSPFLKKIFYKPLHER